MAEYNGKIGHLEGIESPWGNAGGVVKTLREVELMAKTGVGWIEAGSYTLEERKGNSWNPKIQDIDPELSNYDFDPDTQLTHNSLGMPNKGMDVVETEIPSMARLAHSHNKALVVNVAPVTNDPLSESEELIKRAYLAGADAVILNAGCPNVKNTDKTQHTILSKNTVEFGRVLHGLAAANFIKPIWVRISPQDSRADMKTITDHIMVSGIVSAVLTPNTWPVPMPYKTDGNHLLGVKMESVGRSGPGMADEAHLQTVWARLALLHSGVDVIRSSGIVTATELHRSLRLGAVAGAGTTFYYESEFGWKEDTDRLLSDLVSIDNS